MPPSRRPPVGGPCGWPECRHRSGPRTSLSDGRLGRRLDKSRPPVPEVGDRWPISRAFGSDREDGLGGPWFAAPFVEKSYRLPMQHGKNVTVGVERGRDRLGAKQFLDDLRVNAGRQHDRGCRVTEIVNPNVRQSGGGKPELADGSRTSALQVATMSSANSRHIYIPASRASCFCSSCCTWRAGTGLPVAACRAAATPAA